LDNPPLLRSIAPFWIVRDVLRTIDFYRDRLGFELTFLGPDGDPYFAILEREGAWLMVKAILPEVQATPNPTRHPWARWDAFISTPEPDRLAADFSARGLDVHAEDNDDGLRGFEVKDPDGYVIYFGRPR
jgi:catechol 2,3-dioxygenase-like lactoylglutathione lyase family enzyme